MSIDETSQIPAEDPLYSRKVLEVVTLANEYCLFLEKASDHGLQALTGFLHKITPLIYLKCALLPDLEVTDEECVEHYVTEEQWETVFNDLRNLFGPVDEFYFIDRYERNHLDPVKGSLSEFFTDTYQDLKDFLLLYQNPVRAFKENAVIECKRLFASRFGLHLACMMPVLHSIVYPISEQDGAYFD